MGDTVRLDAGTKVGWDLVDLDGVYKTQTGLGAEAYLGADLSLNPSDDVRAMLVASGTGLLHTSDAGRFFGVAPELGLGVAGDRFYARLMGGPLWTDKTSELNGTGRFDFGIHLGEKIALTLGARYMLLPNVGVLRETKTDYVIDPVAGTVDFMEIESQRPQDASIWRYTLGFEVLLP